MKPFDSDKDYPCINNGDYYLVIAGSLTDGFSVHYYRKLGFDSVTNEFKSIRVSYEELIELLNNKENLLRKSTFV